jgi:3-hydroxybutyryl-CoA dehydrogenase
MDSVKMIVVVGGGALGSGIARAVASVGFNTMIIESSREQAEKTMVRIERRLDRDIEKWRLTGTEKTQILSRINSCCEIDWAAQADLVIEAIPEEFDEKVAVFSQLDKICRPEVIFITTTASLSITRMSTKFARPELLIGMNFQLPVEAIPVVEVVSGLKTNDATRDKIERFAKRLRKEVITVYESPGYVTTRVILPFINEAMYVVMEGVASAADVDKAIKLSYNLPQGPLSMADSIGLDTVLQWMEQLFHQLGDLKYRPCPLLRKLVNADHLGCKTGEGFFTYPKDV